MVAEPVLGMLSATTMPSLDVMSPEVWSLMVTVLDWGERGKVSEGRRESWGVPVKGRREANAHPLDGFSQVNINGSPASA